MLNYYSSNYDQAKKPYNQINIEKITKQINNNKQRASSINMEKIKTKSKIMPTTNSLSKKNNNTLKTISVNKQMQYKKKTPIKNQNPLNKEKNFFTSYNGISSIKDTSYNATNKIIKNQNINNLNKNTKMIQGKNGSNNYSYNKLRRKMVLSVDLNNKKNNIKNISQINDINNNLKLVTDIQMENQRIDNNSNTTSSFNNISNPTSNGAKTDNINNNGNKPKVISVNHQNQIKTNVIIKSPEKNYNSNIFNTCIGASDKKIRTQKNNIGINKSNNKKINLQIKQPLKLFEDNSTNLTNSGNYQVNFTNYNFNEKKYIKPQLKNSNSSNFYKLNHNNHANNHNNYDTNNYKFLKEVIDIQAEMEKNMKDNLTNSKSKKYNTLKHSFENLLKLLGNTIFKNNNSIINTLLEKILIGYHEVVSAFSQENRKLKQVNYNLNEQYEKMSKDLFNLTKNLKEKQKQIENLKNKIKNFESEKLKENFILGQKHDINNIKIQTEQNKKIFQFNEQNIEDLDALYFYDKVKMIKKKSVSIPKILIKQNEEQDNEEEEEEYEEEDERSKTMNRTLTNGEFFSVNELKLESPFLIRVRQAFM